MHELSVCVWLPAGGFGLFGGGEGEEGRVETLPTSTESVNTSDANPRPAAHCMHV